MNTKIRFSEILGIEWYDGWIAALLNSGASSFLCFAVAINPEKKQRVFAICEVQESQGAAISHTFRNQGVSAELEAEWKAALSSKNVFICNEEPTIASEMLLTSANREQIDVVMQYGLPVVEMAFAEEAIEYWLER